MPIKFACEHCARTLRVPDGSSGKQSKCPACRHLQKIPAAAQGVRSNARTAKGAHDAQVRVPCPECNHLLSCSPELLGKRGHCRSCGHIFTISLRPGDQAVSQPVGPIFSCPACHQMFEGQEDMRGRKGKCHACHAVFTIPLSDAQADNQASSTRKEGAPLNGKARGADTLSDAQSHATADTHVEAGGSTGAKQLRSSGPVRLERARSTKEQPKREPTPSKSAETQPQAIALSPRVLVGSVTPQSALLDPASVQRRVGRAHSGGPGRPSVSIRFACRQCQGLMEVPGACVGMDTACPFCQTIQTIPARSSEPKLQDADPFAGVEQLEFVASPAALQNQWVAQSVTRRRSDLTIANVFQVAFRSLFPSCLVALLHAAIVGLYTAVGLAIALGVMLLLQLIGLPPVSLQIAAIVCFSIFGLSFLVVAAWFSAAVRHMALRAVRGLPFDIAKALSPGGAFGVSLIVIAAIALLQLLMRVPVLIEGIWPGSVGSLGLLWLLIMLPVLVIAQMLFSFAWFAAMDGQGAGQAIATSCQLLCKHFPVMLAVKVLTWLITIPLAILTLGFAMVLPLYVNATLYKLARHPSR